MATLQTQYKNYIERNPHSKFTFDEWLKFHGDMMKQAFQDMVKKLDDKKISKKYTL